MKLSIKWHKEAKAIVHVRDDSRLQVKDSTIYVGDSWKPEENFVSATDKTGQDVPSKKSLFQVKLITPKRAFAIIYSYEGKEETANVTVKPDQSKLEVKDSTIYVGDSWKPEDNFVSATDRDGHAISFDKVQVKGKLIQRKQESTRFPIPLSQLMKPNQLCSHDFSQCFQTKHLVN